MGSDLRRRWCLRLRSAREREVPRRGSALFWPKDSVRRIRSSACCGRRQLRLFGPRRGSDRRRPARMTGPLASASSAPATSPNITQGVPRQGIERGRGRRRRSSAGRGGRGRWGIEQWFGDGAELLAACRPTACRSSTPGNQHREPTIAALAADCSVLLEKPVATSSVEVAVIEAAGQASGASSAGHILRFAAPYRSSRRGSRGLSGSCSAMSAVRDRSVARRRFPDIHPALMTTIHDIDLALWLSDARAVRVVLTSGRAARRLAAPRVGPGRGSRTAASGRCG